ncbi:MAG: cyclase family protein [Balneolaceae bacterium]
MTSGKYWEKNYRAAIKKAITKAGVEIQQEDTVLLYTDHYRRNYGTNDWQNGPGITADTTRWLGEQEIAAFDVETMSPGIRAVAVFED